MHGSSATKTYLNGKNENMQVQDNIMNRIYIIL